MEQSLDMTRFWPEVLQVVPTDDFRLYAYFNDGSVRMFDVRPIINPGTVFESLMDINLFKSKITVINGTVAWDFKGDRDPRKCIDLDPLVLFQQPTVPDPLA